MIDTPLSVPKSASVCFLGLARCPLTANSQALEMGISTSGLNRASKYGTCELPFISDSRIIGTGNDAEHPEEGISKKT
jgi:hypothetical protein